MALLQLLYYPDDPLTQKADPVEVFDDKLSELVDDMIETMQEYKGVGLAAPQIGLSKRVFVLQEPDGPQMCFINPRITMAEGREEGERAEGDEEEQTPPGRAVASQPPPGVVPETLASVVQRFREEALRVLVAEVPALPCVHPYSSSSWMRGSRKV